MSHSMHETIHNTAAMSFQERAHKSKFLPACTCLAHASVRNHRAHPGFTTFADMGPSRCLPVCVQRWATLRPVM